MIQYTLYAIFTHLSLTNLKPYKKLGGYRKNSVFMIYLHAIWSTVSTQNFVFHVFLYISYISLYFFMSNISIYFFMYLLSMYLKFVSCSSQVLNIISPTLCTRREIILYVSLQLPGDSFINFFLRTIFPLSQGHIIT